MEAQIAYTTNPMMDTEFNMVAKTVVPGGSPPSTTAGSTGETVLNETAFDVSEIFETVNPVGPEARQIRARIGGMTCDELVNLLESNGADGGFLESVLSGGMTGAEFKDMLVERGDSTGGCPALCQRYRNGAIQDNGSTVQGTDRTNGRAGLW